jgi:aryl-alcohol dehydrogenase-like predicted oxidoreductase
MDAAVNGTGARSISSNDHYFNPLDGGAPLGITKVWTCGRQAGITQMERSFALLKVERIDLMQVHNLVDWQTHLATLRRWEQDGRFRYLGVTHYTASAYDELEAVMRNETLDFVQLNYSLDDRAAERKLLPLAADRGIAILVNVPFVFAAPGQPAAAGRHGKSSAYGRQLPSRKRNAAGRRLAKAHHC